MRGVRLDRHDLHRAADVSTVPAVTMRVVTLARKPVASSVAVAMVGQHAGALRVDACRVSSRWPTNLLLQHRSGCRCVGTTTVQSDGHFPASRPAGSQVSGPSGHKGQRGLVERYTRGEEVPVWDCASGCPIADFDVQAISRFFKHVGTVSRQEAAHE